MARDTSGFDDDLYYAPGDEDDGLSALDAFDFTPGDTAESDDGELVGLDGVHLEPDVVEEVGGLASVLEPESAAADLDETQDIPLFAVSNPPGTVTVTAMMDGRVHEIELTGSAGSLTEAELAGEIVILAQLAAQKGKAGQFEFLAEQMAGQGFDEVAARDYLARELNLPTPAQAAEEQAAVFATRYAGDHD